MMSHSIKLISAANRQQGISLVVSLIMLLIMTVIGISAMNTSISKLKMTTGIQQQSAASHNADEALNLGEDQALSAANTQLIVDGDGFFRIEDDADLPSKDIWKDDDVWKNNIFTSQDGKANYIIEFLGKRLTEGGSLTNDDVPGETMYIYRITASVNDNNATRMFQSIYVSENKPLDSSVSATQ